MADSDHPVGGGKVPIPRLPPAASSKKSRSVKTLTEKKAYQKEVDRARNKRRINVGAAFQRWRILRDLKGFKSDAELATFLLDSYEGEESAISFTPLKKKRERREGPCPHLLNQASVQRVFQIEMMTLVRNRSVRRTCLRKWMRVLAGRIKHGKKTVQMTPGVQIRSQSRTLLLRKKSRRRRKRRKRRKRKRKEVQTVTRAIVKNRLFFVSRLEETIHDLTEEVDLPEDAHAPPDHVKVICTDDLIGKPASLVYHSCLTQLVDVLLIPIPCCESKDQVSGAKCGAARPFEVKVHSRGTSVVLQWICSQGHIVWRWNCTEIWNAGWGVHAGFQYPSLWKQL
ncbi:uncharacterized protein LOC141809663 [Halichoeres trimaculatus]|uniref:uncharacterized protein LOC141809663 n=1 Tax=Halichoeres trimaculatus TaxID=147232 RepID=UPI003D9FAA39